jgi:DNA mismatch endonuclease (patch repair protein)
LNQGKRLSLLMADVVNAHVRSRMMAGIRAKNTVPEMTIRRALHRRGFRYRLHSRKLPGKPDLVFPKFGAVVFVHGCFWHGHDCHLFKWPSSRKRFWRKKIEGTRRRDRVASEMIVNAGWRILTIWECAIKGRTRCSDAEVVEIVARWLTTGTTNMDLQGARL